MQNIPRILFVDDHEDTRFMIKFWLAQFNYEVETAASLAIGLTMAQKGSFDLFVFDSIFPDGTGAELCRQIRAFDSRTPIIFYSGDTPERLRSAVECGAQASVMKPELDGLRKAIFRAINVAPTSN
jgi:CheY-like chemotaxis protein